MLAFNGTKDAHGAQSEFSHDADAILDSRSPIFYDLA